jgi:hypothetical protein
VDIWTDYLKSSTPPGGAEKSNTMKLTKFLAWVGVVLAWGPILAPALLAVIAVFNGRGFLLDYLMPAELFPLALVGGGFLLWAALRAHSRTPMIAWGLGLAFAFLVGSQALAVATGLATGATEPGGWQWAVVVSALVLYTLALVTMGLGGILLLRDVTRKGG